MTKKTYIRRRGDDVEMKQVAGEDGVVNAGAAKDLPDSGGADLVAEAGEFAVDPSVAPGGVLGGQAEDQGAQAGGDGWPTGSGG
jgi:hypothetical protein